MSLESIAEGDLRKAITFLQSASYLQGKEQITPEVIFEISGVRGCLLLCLRCLNLP